MKSMFPVIGLVAFMSAQSVHGEDLTRFIPGPSGRFRSVVLPEEALLPPMPWSDFTCRLAQDAVSALSRRLDALEERFAERARYLLAHDSSPGHEVTYEFLRAEIMDSPIEGVVAALAGPMAGRETRLLIGSSSMFSPGATGVPWGGVGCEAATRASRELGRRWTGFPFWFNPRSGGWVLSAESGSLESWLEEREVHCGESEGLTAEELAAPLSSLTAAISEFDLEGSERNERVDTARAECERARRALEDYLAAGGARAGATYLALELRLGDARREEGAALESRRAGHEFLVRIQRARAARLRCDGAAVRRAISESMFARPSGAPDFTSGDAEPAVTAPVAGLAE